MKLIKGSYGHRLSGKLFDYWGDDNLRAGQRVVVPVRNPKSQKLYHTMLTISSTKDSDTDYAQNEASRVNNRQDNNFGNRETARDAGRLGGSGLKHVIGTDVMSLKGAKEFGSSGEWTKASNEKYRSEIKSRLAKPTTNNIDAIRSNLLGGT